MLETSQIWPSGVWGEVVWKKKRHRTHWQNQFVLTKAHLEQSVLRWANKNYHHKFMHHLYLLNSARDRAEQIFYQNIHHTQICTKFFHCSDIHKNLLLLTVVQSKLIYSTEEQNYHHAVLKNSKIQNWKIYCTNKN